MVREKGEITPVDMLLFCPKCEKQQIDEASPLVCQECGAGETNHNTGEDNATCPMFVAWLNPPHKSHRCYFCNTVWRPFEYPTNGVLITNGQ